MNRRFFLRVIGTVTGLALAIGCTLGPEPERPVTAADVSDTYVHAPEGGDTGLPAVSPWWRTFGDQTTTELVELALENNVDLQVAAARVLEAEAGLRRAGGARLPQAGYGAGAQRQKMSFVLPGTGRREIYSTTYSDDFDITWQADLFGRLKRTRQSSWASLLSEEAAQEALVHTVVALVVRSRVQIAILERAVAITREITASWGSTLKTVERRYRSGLADAVDLHLARENLASAQAAGVVIEGQLEQARLALDVLVGRRPGSGAQLPDTLAELPSLEPVPLGLPAELLDRRPDLRQAEMQLAAATYGVGAALANLYPDLSLTGSAGMRSDTLTDIVSVDGLVYNAVANLVGPIFTGGQRRADVDAARARTDQAVADYAGAVLQALREVEDALVSSDASERNLDFTRQRVSEARAADRLAKQRYQRGVATMLTVLETERRLRLAEQAIITATADVWNARIDLFLALGGDWGTHLPASETDPTEESKTQARSENPKSKIRNPKSTASIGRAAIPHSSFLIPHSKEVS
jgi:multidrug efflux system outer membrane protein